jgi:hypothetical protein
MRLSLTVLATLALAIAAKAEKPALADVAAAAAPNATAPITDAAVEEAFEPNTIVQKHIGGDLLVLSVL